MGQLKKGIHAVGAGFNYIACLATLTMMIITCVDVVLRFLGKPVPGTYELVGFAGTAVVSFSLAYTSLQKGHIVVEMLVEKFPKKIQFLIDSINSLIGFFLFSILTWQSLVYALDLRKSGEVSLTLEISTYPFVIGISTGCGLLCIVLLMEFIVSIRRVTSP